MTSIFRWPLRQRSQAEAEETAPSPWQRIVEHAASCSACLTAPEQCEAYYELLDEWIMPSAEPAVEA